jgi:hypothetical protein
MERSYRNDGKARRNTVRSAGRSSERSEWLERIVMRFHLSAPPRTTDCAPPPKDGHRDL